MGERPPVSSELSRELSLFHITMMGLGMMIGAGVFLGVGNAMHVVGPGGVILTFALNGCIAIFTAMSYAELSSAIPRAGGAYNFARIGFGRGTSFIAGWMEWFASSVAGSVYALTFAIYTLRYFEQLGFLGGFSSQSALLVKGVAVLAAGFFLYTNFKGASETGKIGAFFTLGQMGILGLIGIAGVVVAFKDPSRLTNFDPFMPNGWGKLLVTMGFTYVAFEGFEVIAQAGDETIDPKRNMPKAMLYSVFFVTLTYIIVAFATVVAVKAGSPGVDGAPWEWIGSFRERGFGEAVARLMPFGNFLLTLAVICSATSALNATIYSATRASYALGRDRMLPAAVAAISKKRKTPYVALLLTGLIIICVATCLPTMDVASSASIMFLFLFFLVNICAIRIRWNMSDEMHYGFVMPLFPLFPIVAIIFQAVLAIGLGHVSRMAWIVAPTWIVVGLLIYRFYSRTRAIPSPSEIHVLEEESAPAGDEYSVMIGVANPDTVLPLVRNTYRICEAKKARVELLHMVPVPDQVALSDAREFMLEGKEGIVEAMLYFSAPFPLSTTIRYCRNIARGVISAVKEKKINMLILGWTGKTHARTFHFGSTIDPAIERAPTNVVVMKNCGDQKYERVLVPVAGGRNGPFAMEMAHMLADRDNGMITVFTVESERNFDINEFVEETCHAHGIPRGRVEVKVAPAGKISETILEESNGYDLVVLGCTEQSLLYRATRQSIPELIAARCARPLVMVRAAGGVRKWLRRYV